MHPPVSSGLVLGAPWPAPACERISDGESLRAICEDAENPDRRAVYRRLADPDDRTQGRALSHPAPVAKLPEGPGWIRRARDGGRGGVRP